MVAGENQVLLMRNCLAPNTLALRMRGARAVGS